MTDKLDELWSQPIPIRISRDGRSFMHSEGRGLVIADIEILPSYLTRQFPKIVNNAEAASKQD